MFPDAGIDTWDRPEVWIRESSGQKVHVTTTSTFFWGKTQNLAHLLQCYLLMNPASRCEPNLCFLCTCLGEYHYESKDKSSQCSLCASYVSLIVSVYWIPFLFAHVQHRSFIDFPNENISWLANVSTHSYCFSPVLSVIHSHMAFIYLPFQCLW